MHTSHTPNPDNPVNLVQASASVLQELSSPEDKDHHDQSFCHVYDDPESCWAHVSRGHCKRIDVLYVSVEAHED